MKKLKILLSIFLLIPLLLQAKEEEKNDSNLSEKQLLNYSVSLGLGYQSFVSYIKQEQAMESFLTLNFSAVYYPLSFLSISYHLGVGILSFYNLGSLSNDNLIYFPKKVERINVENSLALEFFGFINNDSLLYFSVGPSYIYMGQLNKQDIYENPNYYKNSIRHLLLFKTALGSRFALYNHTLMDVQMYLMFPFKKMSSWSNEGAKEYKQIIFGFEVSIGFFD